MQRKITRDKDGKKDKERKTRKEEMGINIQKVNIKLLRYFTRKLQLERKIWYNKIKDTD